MPPEITRRTFLFATAGLAVLAACGDDEPDVSVPRASSTTRGAAGPLSIVLGSFSPVAGLDERVAFAVLEGSPPRPVDGGPDVTVTFEKVEGGERSEPVRARYHHEGIEERPYWEIRRTFAEPGNYVMRVEYGGRPAQAGLKVAAPGELKSPVTGEALPAVASPTTADPMGVDPLCTRKPPCPLHDISIPDALAQKKPLILLFSTPALCASAICGPVLDILLDAQERYAGRANAIHVEVYKDLTGQEATETFKAFNLQIEPIFYFVKADGTIAERFDGPVDRVELAEAVDRLLAG